MCQALGEPATWTFGRASAGVPEPGRVELRANWGIDYDLSAGSLETGRFLRLLYGGCLRLASPLFRGSR